MFDSSCEKRREKPQVQPNIRNIIGRWKQAGFRDLDNFGLIGFDPYAMICGSTRTTIVRPEPILETDSVTTRLSYDELNWSGYGDSESSVAVAVDSVSAADGGSTSK